MLLGTVAWASAQVTTTPGSARQGPGAASKPATEPPPRTEELAPQRTPKGSVAIVKDELPRNVAAASPERLAKVLHDAGYGVTFLRLGDLIDRSALNKRNFDVLMLPNGVYYPAQGKEALVAYLAEGGSFFSTGGYAFDTPVVYTANGWQPTDGGYAGAKANEDKTAVGINTRFGRPGDVLGLAPDQIGVFDPAYMLSGVACARAAPAQHVLTEAFRLDGRLDGFAATALTGSNNPVFPDAYARWIPLVDTYDRYGRLRGAAGALVHHYAGPFAGSSWAFFGVTNRDVLSEPPLSSSGFVRIIDALMVKTFLHDLATDRACYRRGESVKISVEVVNQGPRARDVAAEFLVDGQIVHGEKVSLKPGQDREVSAVWRPDADSDRDFCTIAARLCEDGNVTDEMRTGLVIWDETIVNGGPRITYRDNYFWINGRPQFLTGTNQTGMMWYSARENPRVWDRDFAKMRDCGLTLLRILHFSPFASEGYEGRMGNDPLRLKVPPPERLVRQTDAIVQLAQKHGIVIFLSLHDWMQVDLTDAELAAQRNWNCFWTERYRHVPGIIYDIQNEPYVRLANKPHLKQMFNEHLRGRYGKTEHLRRAWNLQTPIPEFGGIDVEKGSGAWDDVRTFDLNLFKVSMLDRWIRVNAQGIREGDPGAIFTVGYLSNMPPADKVLGAKHTTFSNMHWYGPISELPLQLKLIDRRFDGKSFSLGEFGAQEAHDARVRGVTCDHDAPSISRYLATAHYALGLGASFVADWCWKDLNDCIFPWGLNHSQDLVSKKKLLAYRAMSLLFSRFEPCYEAPPLYLLVPDNHRLGAKFRQVHAAIRNCIRLLLECHVNFNVINEYDLGRLPGSARAIVYPVPYCPSDETFARLLEFVKSGGALYLSGDIAYDESRRRTRTQRFAQLGLPETPAREPLTIETDHPSSQPLSVEVGQGSVFFVPDAIELRASKADLALYRRFIDLAGARSIGMTPDDPNVHAFSVPTSNGGTIYVLFHTDAAASKTVQLTDTPRPIALTLGPYKPGLAWVSTGGALLAAEASGVVRVGSRPLLSSQGQMMVTALDGHDLGTSQQLLILPLEAGEVNLSSQAAWPDPVIAAGEFERGQWRLLEQWCPDRGADGLRCEVTADRALKLLILAGADHVNEATRRIMSPDSDR